MIKTPKLRFKEFSGGWERVTLKQVTNGFEYGMNSASTEFDGVNKYIRITDIDENTSKYINTNVVSPLGKLEDKYLVKENDILFARTGASTGKTYLYDNKDGKLYFAGFLIRANVNSYNNSKFIFLQTKSGAYDKWVKVMSMRSGQPGINSQEYASYSFNAPSKEEQDKIASFFSLIDDKISLQDEKVEALKDYKKGMMQKIFSRELRFKDDEGCDYPEWKHKKLNSIVERVTRKNKGLQSTLPLTISAQYGLVDQITFFNKTVASSNLEGYYLLEKGEFAYNKSYSTGYPFGAIKRLDNYDKGVLSSLYICFAPLENMDSDFLLQYFETSCWHKEISMIAVEGARNHGLLNISVSDFFETYHWIPSYEEQIKIGKFLCQIDEKVAKEQAKLDSLNEYKKGLLQQMFV